MNSIKSEYSSNSYEQIAKKLSAIDKRINMLYEDKVDGKLVVAKYENIVAFVDSS